MRNRFSVIAALLLVGSMSCLHAAPASSLVISLCPTPGCTPPPLVNLLGRPFSFYVFALDASGNPATNYANTVSISSSDHAATLPNPHSFVASDGAIFGFTLTFNSLPPGSHDSALLSVTATDSTNLTTTAQFFVERPLGVPVAQTPSLSALLQIALAIFIVLIALGMRRSATRTSS